MIHPELRARVREVFRQELRDVERAESLVLSLDAAWAVLGYQASRRPWDDQELHALASIAAGLLEAERHHAGASDSDVHRRVKLCLIHGGKSVVASSHDDQVSEE